VAFVVAEVSADNRPYLRRLYQELEGESRRDSRVKKSNTMV
jgi:hypothetical protein